MNNCIEETGKILTLNNQDIVKYLCSIEDERNNLEIIIQKQYQERKKIEAEIERLTYKLCLINKSLSMRIKAKNNYDRTIEEIKNHYQKLVDSSNALRQIVEKTQQELDDIMNKRIGTSAGPNGEEVRMLYVKSNEPADSDECPCVYIKETPTRENEETTSKPPSKEVSLEYQDQDLESEYTDSDKPTVAVDTEYDTESENLTITLMENANKPFTEKVPEPKKPFEEKISDEAVEVEVASVMPNNGQNKGIQPLPIENQSNQTNMTLNDSSTKNRMTPVSTSPYTSLKPMPEHRNSQQEDRTTNMLLSRLRISLTKINEDSKNRDEATIAQNRLNSPPTSVTPSKDNYTSPRRTMEK